MRGKLIPGCTTHQQIGAVCDDTFAEGKVQFCDTLLECNLYCNGDCKSKSVSCLADCR